MKTEKAIENLKKDIATPLACGECTICCIEDLETLLNHLTKQEKMIGLMTNFIYHIGYYEDIYGNSCAIIQDSCFKNKTTESCEQCIKQYFENKANEEVE